MEHRGFIQLLILVVILVILLSILGISLREVLGKDVTQDNFKVVGELLEKAWGYLKAPLRWVWNEIFRPLLAKIIS